MVTFLPVSAPVRPLETGQTFTFGNFERFPFVRRLPTKLRFQHFNCTSAEMAAAGQSQPSILETLQWIFISYISLLFCACLLLPGHYKKSQQLSSYVHVSDTQLLTTPPSSARSCHPSSGIPKSSPLTLGFASVTGGVTVPSTFIGISEQLHSTASVLRETAEPMSLHCNWVARKINPWERWSCLRSQRPARLRQ